MTRASPRYWLLAFLLMALTSALWAAPFNPKVLDAHSAQSRIPLWQSLETLADPQGVLTPASAAQAFDSGQGEKLPAADHAYGKWIPYPYWARFSLQNNSDEPQTWLLSYELPTQDSAALWKATANIWQPFPMLDEAESSFASGQLFTVWRLTLKAHETQSFLLKLDGYNLMRFPIFAMRDDAFNKQQRSLYLGLGFVLAIPLVVLLYVLTLIRIAEDKSLPLFIVMALAEMLGAGWVSGLMHATLPSLDRWTSGWLGWSGYVLLLGLSCLHARVFMDTAKTDKFADKLLQVQAWAWLFVLPLFAIYQPNAARLCLLIGGTLHAFILTWLSVRAYLRLSKNSERMHVLIFIAVWVIYAGSGIVYVAYRIAHLPAYVTLMTSFTQGSIVAALLGCAVSVQVIRQRREMQESVTRVTDRNHLYAAAHHDLWQPIQSVGLYAAAIPSASEAQKYRFLKGIESAVTSVHDFMEGLRQDEIKVRLEAVSLHELLAPLVEEYRHIASGKHISLRYVAKQVNVQTDPVLLKRIVRNLLSNAIRYTNKGGRILLGCRRYQGKLWLMVYDNGIGMTDEQTARCFDVFTREGDTERIPEGMGLGLYSVKRIANQLNARVRLISQPDKGTAIGVSLHENLQNQG